MEKKEKPIGKVTHYFSKINVAVVKLNDVLKIGERIAFRGATSDFTQSVDSLEVDHASIQQAKRGSEVGMRVKQRVREGDQIFRV